jgi:hypothetical protein
VTEMATAAILRANLATRRRQATMTISSNPLSSTRKSARAALAAATMQALAGEILRVRTAMSQIVELITPATEGRDSVLVRARPMSPPMASASGS